MNFIVCEMHQVGIIDNFRTNVNFIVCEMHQVGIIDNFHTNSNVNKLKIVAKQINSNTN